MSYSGSDPIFALASGSLPSPVSVLRLSGTQVHRLLGLIVQPIKPGEWSPAKLRLSRIIDPDSGDTLDEPLVCFFYGPHSYTGEDAAEIHLHGGRYILQACTRLLQKIGFRQAEPGEFTQRAFYAGKMDLTAAEGIQELIAAQSEQQWLASRQLTTGKLKDAIESLRESLLGAMAYLEARIDFPDEKETSALSLEPTLVGVQEVKASLLRLKESYQGGKVAAEGLKVALFGKPNSGKSTLMNALLEEERAIVTEDAGTTRDYLEEPCLIKGRLFRIVDTAGIRHTENRAEKIGVERSVAIAKQADLVLFLNPQDAQEDQGEELEKWVQEIGLDRSLLVTTKIDLRRAPPQTDVIADSSAFSLSAHSGEGLELLKTELCRRSDQWVAPLKNQETVLTSARHLAAVEECLRRIEAFEEAASQKAYDEILAFELQGAASALDAVIGRIESDDVLGAIFGAFCIGK